VQEKLAVIVIILNMANH